MKFKFLLLLSFSFLLSSYGASKFKRGFAIVVDQKSYDEAKSVIDEYAKSIEAQGLKVYLLADTWPSPNPIRKQLKALYYKNTTPIEGAVFIGDIPVPMLRDAQHFTSAFKMDQEKYAWDRSSIPSDRFYDDFDLQFTYLKQDTAKTLYHYYSLNADSPQRLTVDIYTARIKPPEGENKYELLKAYLKKVVDYKRNPIKVDQLLFFTGHGYNSECPRTWMDEKIAISQQFDYLSGQKNFMEYINFQFDDHIKFRLMSELKRQDLDIALLHHHGGPTTQYLDGMPEKESVPDEIENVKFYLRSKLRSAGPSQEKIASTRLSYMKTYGVTENWFDGTFDKEQIQKDSIYSADLDLNIEDLSAYSSNARFIMLDACFNGSFHRDQYQAGAYIFDPGQTIVVQANSVNAYQDKWSDEMVGLLGLGMRIGFWNQTNCSLETHLIGDPTFAFQPADPKIEINKWLGNKEDRISFWEKQLHSQYADVQALAINRIFKAKGAKASDLFLNVFKTSKNYSTRAEAFKVLSLCRDQNFITAINWGISDSYELIQRLSAIYMGRTGDVKHIPYMIEALLRNNLSQRVAYDLKTSIGLYNKDLLMAELEKQLPQKEYLLDSKAKRAELTNLVEYNTNRMQDYVTELLSDKTSVKERYFNLRNFRNMNVHPYLDELIQFTDTVSDPHLKMTAIEMLGWFDDSSEREKIIQFCNKELSNSNLPEPYLNEVKRTKNRIY